MCFKQLTFRDSLRDMTSDQRYEALDMIPILAGSNYIMDRGYLDFERLYHLHSQDGRFVIRARKNQQY